MAFEAEGLNIIAAKELLRCALRSMLKHLEKSLGTKELIMTFANRDTQRTIDDTL